MPRFDALAPGAGPVVRGFAAGGRFVVDGVDHRGVLLTPERAIEWDVAGIGDLTIESVEPALAIQPPPEFLLLGTGPSLVRPSPAFVKAVEAQGIGVEAMDSRAAARTWGVLRAEHRWIAAALLPLS